MTSTVSVCNPFHVAMWRRAISGGTNSTTGGEVSVRPVLNSLMVRSPDLRDRVSLLERRILNFSSVAPRPLKCLSRHRKTRVLSVQICVRERTWRRCGRQSCKRRNRAFLCHADFTKLRGLRWIRPNGPESRPQATPILVAWKPKPQPSWLFAKHTHDD